MRSADPPLVVVTTSAGGVRAGCLVGFHGQASIEPAQYAVWLSKANHTYRVALGATHLGVHFLGADDQALAERFGTTSGEDVDKFSGLEVTEGPDGLPLLAALPHRLVGRRSALLDVGGDHVCLPLEIQSAEAATPLTVLRLHDAAHLIPGHEADERSVGVDG